MAEIGLIASVIQVAGAGLKLSQTLYQYADGVASADRRVRDIATEVDLTSCIIKELGTLFQLEETSHLLSANALKTANKTVLECSSVFTELDAALKKSKKNTLGRLMLPFRESKIELLRRHIDTLKSTLQLLLQVLTHAHQVAAQKLDREAEAKQREQIKALLQSKKESAKRYEESLRNYSMSEGSTTLDDDGSDKETQTPMIKTNPHVAPSSTSPNITATTLEECVKHIRGLLDDIEALQKALSKEEEDQDHSERHQSVIGSYFRARGHLDSVFLGNPHSSKMGHSDLVSMPTDSAVEALDNKSQVITFEDKREGSQATSSEKRKRNAGASAAFRARRKEKEREAAAAISKLEQLQGESERRVQDEVAKRVLREVKSATPERQLPIAFKDAVGRNYSFPFRICNTWEGIERLIKQAFAHAGSMTKCVFEGKYDLINQNGEVVLPSLWESAIQPGWFITMHMWPTRASEELPPSSARSSLTLPPGVEGIEVLRKSRSESKSRRAHLIVKSPESETDRSRSDPFTELSPFHYSHAHAIPPPIVHEAYPRGSRRASSQETKHNLGLNTLGKGRCKILETFKTLGVPLSTKTADVLLIAHTENKLPAKLRDYVIVIYYDNGVLVPRPDDAPLGIIEKLFDEGRNPTLVYERKTDFDDYSPTSPVYSPVSEPLSPTVEEQQLRPISLKERRRNSEVERRWNIKRGERSGTQDLGDSLGAAHDTKQAGAHGVSSPTASSRFPARVARVTKQGQDPKFEYNMGNTQTSDTEPGGNRILREQQSFKASILKSKKSKKDKRRVNSKADHESTSLDAEIFVSTKPNTSTVVKSIPSSAVARLDRPGVGDCLPPPSPPTPVIADSRPSNHSSAYFSIESPYDKDDEVDELLREWTNIFR